MHMQNLQQQQQQFQHQLQQQQLQHQHSMSGFMHPSMQGKYFYHTLTQKHVNFFRRVPSERMIQDKLQNVYLNFSPFSISVVSWFSRHKSWCIW